MAKKEGIERGVAKLRAEVGEWRIEQEEQAERLHNLQRELCSSPE